MTAASSGGYGALARAFHWLTAFLIFALFALGWYMADLELTDPNKFRLYQIHKSIGITVFVLALLRLAWRLTHKAPPWPAHMTPLERLAAAGAHWALYGLILLQPFLGILQSNAANFPIVFWGGYELPALIGPDEAVAERLLGLHHLFANVLAGLVLLHVAAALRHHIQLKDDVLKNMMPSPGVGAAVIVLTLVLVAPPFLLIEADRPAATAGETDAVVETTDADAEASPTSPATEAPPASDGADAGEATGMAWTIEEGSALGFIALQQGSEVVGGFDAFDASILFDPDDLEGSRIDVEIDVTSINTGQGDRDKTLNSPSFFETERWPSAVFKSGAITARGEDRYEAAGTLTMRDVTKDVVLPFTLSIDEDPGDAGRLLAKAKGELPILRLEYGIGQGDWASTTTVADEVVITIAIEASRSR